VCGPPNDLAFSCERTKQHSDQKMMRGAFVGCNGLLGVSERPTWVSMSPLEPDLPSCGSLIRELIVDDPFRVALFHELNLVTRESFANGAHSR